MADAEVHWVAWFDPFYPTGLIRPIDWFDLALGPQMFTSFESSSSGDGVTDSDGIFLIDAQGRRIMDFHGNSAHQVGYGDQSAFSRAFRRVWGETPAAYRRARKAAGSA